MRSATVGVIGHVDHGKTALVRALTGIDTDRLAEEKRRGISIVLGFSHLAVAGGEIDLIDMPGHERFVRTMISGATGIDAVLLVVDAREGIQPQTVEHAGIAGLIGVRRGIVAVTKCDLVPVTDAVASGEAAIKLARAAGIGEVTAVRTSAMTGEGLDELRLRLGSLLDSGGGREDAGVFWLPTDRVFAVPGFGTVVTGTLRRGALSVGDEVELMPGGRKARVRSLQIHGRPVEAASPGRRVAVNLRGVEQSDVPRGTALASPGLLTGSRWLDAGLTLLTSAPEELRSGTVVRLLTGTVETLGDGSGCSTATGWSLGKAPWSSYSRRLPCRCPPGSLSSSGRSPRRPRSAAGASSIRRRGGAGGMTKVSWRACACWRRQHRRKSWPKGSAPPGPKGAGCRSWRGCWWCRRSGCVLT